MSDFSKSKYFVFFVFLSFLYSCASQGNIYGGPKDTQPPVMLKEKSASDQQLNTISRSFQFEFDEFIKVEEVLKEVLISPPLVYIPSVKARGKKVIFTFNEKEVLKENTTYIINFGESVRDFNEGNKLKNFKYVFSTGSQIDSLKVKGKVTELESGKPLANATVMLYEDLSDSIVIRKKPFYTSKTDKEGNFTLENIRKSKYNLIAINDENSNLIYNEGSEKIGFIENPIQWDSASIITQDLIVSVASLTPRIINTKNDKYGVSKSRLNTKLNLIPSYSLSKKLDFHQMEMKEDTLILNYWNKEVIDSFQWFLPYDTINIFCKQLPENIIKLKLNPTFSTRQVLSNDTLKFQVNSIVDSIFIDKITLSDSTGNLPIKAFLYDYKTIGATSKLKPKNNYTLTFYPQSMKDIYGNKFIDTLETKMAIVDPKTLSNLKIELTDLDSTKQYLVTLLSGSNKVKELSLKNVSKTTIYFKSILVDEYSINVLEDSNKNGVFDPSNYWKKTQAEKLQSFKISGLKEGDDFDKTFKVE